MSEMKNFFLDIQYDLNKEFTTLTGMDPEDDNHIEYIDFLEQKIAQMTLERFGREDCVVPPISIRDSKRTVQDGFEKQDEFVREFTKDKK